MIILMRGSGLHHASQSHILFRNIHVTFRDFMIKWSAHCVTSTTRRIPWSRRLAAGWFAAGSRAGGFLLVATSTARGRVLWLTALATRTQHARARSGQTGTWASGAKIIGVIVRRHSAHSLLLLLLLLQQVLVEFHSLWVVIGSRRASSNSCFVVATDRRAHDGRMIRISHENITIVVAGRVIQQRCCRRWSSCAWSRCAHMIRQSTR